MVNRQAIWLLVATMRGRLAAARPQPLPEANLQALSAADCSPLELVIARGTTEPLSPAFGVIVGDPLFEAVQKIIPQATGYKVDYPATFEVQSRNLGRDDVVKHVTEQSKKCPEQKFIMVGYSQGADVMHNGLAKLDQGLHGKIVGLVMFGDPGNKGPNAKSPMNCDPEPVFPEALAQKLRENCEAGDPVCTNDGTIVGSHLVYSDPTKGYIQESAKYIQKQFETNGKAGPQPSPNVGTGDNTAALIELGQVLGGPKNAGACGLGGPSPPAAKGPSRARRQ